jgi:UDP-glucuronate 4-epimerase
LRAGGGCDFCVGDAPEPETMMPNPADWAASLDHDTPVLVTGAAGFIGFFLAERLLRAGIPVVGIDNLNPYYDPKLKQARLDMLRQHPGFAFERLDLADRAGMARLFDRHGFRHVVNLAAQAGVRHSIENPHAYAEANLTGFLNVLEECRRAEVAHLVYASSSSVYGGNRKIPFGEDDRVDHPLSLYAATKRCDELMSHAYAHLYGLAQTGLRYFTVYGPWGRPDMAYWMFTKAILERRPIRVFNRGNLWRDFTYIDDVVSATVKVLDRPPGEAEPAHRIYNIGHNSPEHLGRFIDLLEELLGVEAIRQYEPMQPGDVEQTFADITRLHGDFGFSPAVPLADGLKRFIDWYRGFMPDCPGER